MREDGLSKWANIMSACSSLSLLGTDMSLLAAHVTATCKAGGLKRERRWMMHPASGAELPARNGRGRDGLRQAGERGGISRDSPACSACLAAASTCPADHD